MAIPTSYLTIELLKKALHSRGYTFEQFTLNDRGYTRFIAPDGHSWLTQNSRIGYPFISKAAFVISREKHLAYELCENLGFRAPKTLKFTADYSEHDLKEALKITPLVVKPSDSSLSWGVSLGIVDVSGLKAAITTALKFSSTVLVQEQVEGEEIRFAVVDGVVKAAILRQRPRLVGDGTSTIAQLLDRENAIRLELSAQDMLYPPIDPARIIATGHKLEEVLASEEVLTLGRETMLRDGASIYNILVEVHPSYIETVQELADKLGSRFVVVDIMLHDHRQPQTDSNYAFIEFNTAPVLKLFYSCRDGNHYDVLADIIPMIDATISGEDYEG